MPEVRIDHAALAANWRMLDARTGTARTGAAVKADAYGLGAADVARTLFEAGCRDFFVAWADEGAGLREALGVLDARIFVLQGIDAAAARLCREYALIPVLSAPEEVSAWISGGGGQPAAIQIETGMNRLGLEGPALANAADHVRDNRLTVTLVMSHLATADDPASPLSALQRQRLLEAAKLFPGVPLSLANSAGIFLDTAYHLDLTRPGIALYGGSAGPLSAGLIQPVATLTATVLQLRTARAGETAGYGADALLTRPTRIATVGIGYADGYLRSASGAGVPVRRQVPGPSVFVAGQRAPVLGRVSMDMTLVDVTDLREGAVKPGDTVELFGRNVPIDEVAAAAGTISYELLTGLGPRVLRRRY
ncbi:alanine racemase [Mangrovicella endophytica]|uniref:alanine racemase n=1 Tax=Mangrovicella endophytica TaxID=2066697 RepID=UPI001FE2003E|nr:alanine racemase [Mangrovicella endophytica]